MVTIIMYNYSQKEFFMDRKDFNKKNNAENTERNDIIAGRNPVMEAVRSGRAIESILVARGERNGSVVAIIAKAKQKNIPVKEVDLKKLDFLARGVNHQGIVAQIFLIDGHTADGLPAAQNEQADSLRGQLPALGPGSAGVPLLQRIELGCIALLRRRS